MRVVAMTHVPYLVAGYGITFGALALYAVRVLGRERSLRRREGGE